MFNSVAHAKYDADDDDTPVVGGAAVGPVPTVENGKSLLVTTRILSSIPRLV
jgi:hypothetical protein